MLQLHYSHARFSDCRHAKELCTVSVDNLVSDAPIIQLSVITVYSGSCDDLRQQTSSDDSGRCGNFKSTVFFQTVEGRTYYINVYPYYEGQAGISFGLILDDSLTFDEESSSVVLPHYQPCSRFLSLPPLCPSMSSWFISIDVSMSWRHDVRHRTFYFTAV